MRLRNPLLGVLGLLAVGAVALQLLTGRLALGQAALRVLVAVGVLVLVDRLLVPLARALVGQRGLPGASDGEPPA